MSYGGIGSGTSRISTSADVALNNPADGQLLGYDATADKWKNVATPAAAVSSVAGRTGAVTLTTADVPGAVAAANNLSDLSSIAAARTNLGLGTAATQNASAFEPAGTAAALASGYTRHALPDIATASALYAGVTPTVTTTKQSTSTITSAQALLSPDTGPFLYQGAADFQYGTGTPWSGSYGSTSRYPHTYTAPNTWSQGSFAIEFMTDAQLIEFKFVAISTVAAVRIAIDGKSLMDLPQNIGTYGGTTLVAGSSHVVKVDLGSAAGALPRRWRLEVYSVAFCGLFLPPGATAWKSVSTGGRLLVLGDSITDGSNYNIGQGIGTWLYRFGRMIGCSDVWDQARGGTGYITAGSYDTFGNRFAADIAAYNPNRLIIMGGYNDASGSQTAIASAAASVFSAALALSSKPEITVFGPHNPTATPATSVVNTDATIQAAALSAGLRYVSLVTGKIITASGTVLVDPGPAVSGVYPGQWFNAQNISTYINSTDNVHPTDAGHVYMARRVYSAYTALLPA